MTAPDGVPDGFRVALARDFAATRRQGSAVIVAVIVNLLLALLLPTTASALDCKPVSLGERSQHDGKREAFADTCGSSAFRRVDVAPGPLPPTATAFLYVGAYFDMWPLHELRAHEQAVLYYDPLFHYRHLEKRGTSAGDDLRKSRAAFDRLFEADPDFPLDAAALAKIAVEGIARNLVDAADAHADEGFEGFHIEPEYRLELGDSGRAGGGGADADAAGSPAAPPVITFHFHTRGVRRRLLYVVGTLGDLDPAALLQRATGRRGPQFTTLAFIGLSTRVFAEAAETLWCHTHAVDRVREMLADRRLRLFVHDMADLPDWQRQVDSLWRRNGGCPDPRPALRHTDWAGCGSLYGSVHHYIARTCYNHWDVDGALAG